MVDLLLHLAECGHYYEVQECLKFPAQKCPDILALALIESDGPLNMIRHEIISSLIPIFLGNHSNAASILHHAWNNQVSIIKIVDYLNKIQDIILYQLKA